LSTPPLTYTALSALKPFLSSATPANASTSRHSALGATYTFTLAGTLTKVSLALSTSGIDVSNGLLNIPSQAGYRAFDVFYYLLTSASTPAEREFLGLRHPSSYSLLNKSQTYDPPSYLPAADDAAAAEDFRASLKAIGIKGSAHRGLLSVLAGLLKLGNTTGFLVDDDVLEGICEDAGGLLGLEPDILLRNCSNTEREIFIAGVYEALVDWVISKANDAIATELQAIRDGDSSSEGGVGARTPRTEEDTADTVAITVVEIPGQALGKAAALRGVFDDTQGINAEMKEDGIEVTPAGHSVIKEMVSAVAEVEADLGIMGGTVGREREHERDRREGVLEKVAVEAEVGGFLRNILLPVESAGVTLGQHGRFDLAATIGCSRAWYHLSLHPTDESPASLGALPSMTSAWSAGTVSRQLRAWRLPEWANRRNKNLDFTADFDVEEFYNRYSRLGCKEGKDGIESWILERGWSNGEVVIGQERIWMREGAWWDAETMLDLKPEESRHPMYGAGPFANPFDTGYSATPPNPNGSGFFPAVNDAMSIQGSRENLVQRQHTPAPLGAARSIAPTMARTMASTQGGDYGLGAKGDDKRDETVYYDQDLGRFTGDLDPEFGDPKKIESKPIGAGRRIWVAVVWALTFWIPSPALRYIGRMKRPDVRMAWREKLILILIILLLNATVVFYIVEFGRLLCPNFDKAWNEKEVSYHQGTDDFWVAIHGKVYDITKFYKQQHSDTAIKTTAANMQPFAGQVLDAYFPPPLIVACPGFGIEKQIQLTNNNTAATINSEGLHTSGYFQPNPTSKLYSQDWYPQIFLPKIQEYYKGDLVVTKGTVSSEGNNDNRPWVIIDSKIYDLTNYFHTLDVQDGYKTYQFLPTEVTNIVKNNPGSDVTNQWGTTPAFLNSLNCMNNVFYVGKTDFRDTPKCQVNNYILLAFTIVLCLVILVKFLAALQLGSKRRPAAQDKFVICQVPAYTEGEDQLRKGLDSLTALQYDNKRKLICVICDGMIVGGGNDRPTPKIVLDILGVDPRIDPPALPFKSVGNGSEQLNYGKVYSGLYEYEGNVVPYIVVVKVGKESEQNKSKPGNRGKRDSQILLLNFLNRVHHRAPMSPLELEMFHQINNIIGVDPELYEYLLMVDADTSVREDSLNRLVASCANDAKIAGICGETSLENEERSWWTMIQVYEYYISHHLAKAFESLFGSVTCLPGW
jgi:chitin synthase